MTFKDYMSKISSIDSVKPIMNSVYGVSGNAYGMTAKYLERMEAYLRIAKTNRIDWGAAVSLIYELARLDCHGHFLVPGRYNIDLSGSDLQKVINGLDFQTIAHGLEPEFQNKIVHVAICTTMLYARCMGKNVEIENFLMMIEDGTSTDAISKNLRDVLTFHHDNVKFSDGKYLDIYLRHLIGTDPYTSIVLPRPKAY